MISFRIRLNGRCMDGIARPHTPQPPPRHPLHVGSCCYANVSVTLAKTRPSTSHNAPRRNRREPADTMNDRLRSTHRGGGGGLLASPQQESAIHTSTDCFHCQSEPKEKPSKSSKTKQLFKAISLGYDATTDIPTAPTNTQVNHTATETFGEPVRVMSDWAASSSSSVPVVTGTPAATLPPPRPPLPLSPPSAAGAAATEPPPSSL